MLWRGATYELLLNVSRKTIGPEDGTEFLVSQLSHTFLSKRAFFFCFLLLEGLSGVNCQPSKTA